MIIIAISPIVLVRAPTSGTIAFATSGLAGAAGITCPNSNGNCYNNAAEPAIRADGAGYFYGSLRTDSRAEPMPGDLQTAACTTLL